MRRYTDAEGRDPATIRGRLRMTTFEQSAIPAHTSEFACVDFVNSEFTDHLGSGQSTDRLESPEWLEWFLRRYDLVPDEPDAPPATELVALRRDIRRSL